jgi:translation initiation factor 1
MRKSGQGGLVYSTDSGRTCPACRQPVALVRGLVLDADALAALGKRLRSACGTGGTVKDGVLEVQGDHAERVIELLKGEGVANVKRAGA